MKLFGRELEGYARTLVILVAVLLVSSGLCGLQWAMQDKFANGLGWVLIPLGVVELIAMVLSAGGIVVVLLLWIGAVFYARFGRAPKDGVQRLFEDGDKTKHDYKQ